MFRNIGDFKLSQAKLEALVEAPVWEMFLRLRHSVAINLSLANWQKRVNKV